jgi:anti-anti-sigma regulatory factor
LYDGRRNAGEETVLKITTSQKESRSLTVHLCGQLTGEYVPELEKALDPDAASKIALDMSNVTFVDRKAMEFLCGVKSRVAIENIPAYVMRWIEQEFRCGQSQVKSTEEPVHHRDTENTEKKSL